MRRIDIADLGQRAAEHMTNGEVIVVERDGEPLGVFVPLAAGDGLSMLTEDGAHALREALLDSGLTDEEARKVSYLSKASYPSERSQGDSEAAMARLLARAEEVASEHSFDWDGPFRRAYAYDDERSKRLTGPK